MSDAVCLFLVVIAGLPTFGLVAWVWLAEARAADALDVLLDLRWPAGRATAGRTLS